MLTVGEKIRNARIKKGISQRKLAQKIGVDQGAISRMESGQRGITDIQKVKISKILEEDLMTLFYGQ